MSTVAQTWTIIGAVAAIFVLQNFWLVRYLNDRFGSIDQRFGQIDRRLDEINHRFDRVEDLLRDHDRRITRLERT